MFFESDFFVFNWKLENQISLILKDAFRQEVLR